MQRLLLFRIINWKKNKFEDFERMIKMKKNMRFVKYIVTMILAVALVASMAACGTSAPVESGETTAPTTEPTAPTTAAIKATQPVTETTATTDPATEPTQPKQTISSGNGSGGNSNSATPTAAQPVHTHNYTVSRTVGATCTEDGYTTYVCSCGSTYNDNWTSATGHSWGDWVTTAEPSYDSEGQQTRTCVTCGATDSQSIPKLEAPAVSLDYNAAAAYGNSYAASTYGWIVDSSVDSFYPASSVDVQYAIDNGGQSYINTRMASVVDSTYSNLAALGNTMFGVWCDCFESDGWIYFVVYYG